MELDRRQYMGIDNAGYCLPQDLYQANNFEVGASTLGDNNHHLPITKRRKFFSPEGRLYDGVDLLPVPQVGVFLPHCRFKAHPEICVPHAGRDSGAM